jgi:prolyl-tRNA synthetase
MYSKWLKSYRDLPYLYNQWCSVVRWEKSTRPFLRTSEFLWQEGHTLHETYDEAEKETIQMLNIYKEMCENLLAIPVVTGQKTENEKFAGAEYTYTIEALMHDGKALQSGTSHFLGQHFTKAFDIKYADREGKLAFPYHTSWGASTRLIGGLIMTHGDNRGLVLPPRVAPTQVVIIPIAAQKGNVMEKVDEIYKLLKARGVKVEVDDRANYSAGYKFNDWEMKGVPIRIEIGPKDIENNQASLFRRDLLTKGSVSLNNIEEEVINLLDDIHNTLLNKARKMYEEKTSTVTNYDEFKEVIEAKPGFVKAMWCGETECEKKIKEDTNATIRCMPFEQEHLGDTCFCCGKKAKKMVLIAKAY